MISDFGYIFSSGFPGSGLAQVRAGQGHSWECSRSHSPDRAVLLVCVDLLISLLPFHYPISFDELW